MPSLSDTQTPPSSPRTIRFAYTNWHPDRHARISELAPIPQATAAASLVTATDAPIDSDQAAIADEAEQENQEDANDQGFVIENNGNDATTGGTRA